MRKNLQTGEPDNTWTDGEILYWALKTGALDEAHSISNPHQQVQKSAGQPKESWQ